MAKKTKRKKKRGKGPGKGAKLLLAVLVLGLFSLFLYKAFESINEALNASKRVEAVVDLELGTSGDGPGQFREPWGVATDEQDNFYVSDFGGARVQKFNPRGEQLLVFGKPGKDPGEFNQPSGLFVDSKGNIYVCDTFNHRVQKFDPQGKVLKVWSHGFFGPRSITGNNRDRIYVVDTGNHKIQVFDPDGNFLKEWGGFGTGDGKFREPVGSVVDPDGNLYVADSDNNRIQKFDPNGKFLTAFKVSTWKGKNEEVPYLAFSQGFLYASNASGKSVVKYDPSGKLLSICRKKDKDGFFTATGLAADRQGRFYVVERGPGRIARFSVPAAVPPSK